MVVARIWVALAALTASSLLLAGTLAIGEAGAASSGGIGEETSVPTSSEGGGDSVNRGKYNRLWERVSFRDRRWAHSTSDCESGGDPDAIGGGGRYRGAFQFQRSTWRAAPKSPGGDPIRYTWRTQAVVAVALKRRDGTGHWPVCG